MIGAFPSTANSVFIYGTDQCADYGTGTEGLVPATDVSEAELSPLVCSDVGNSEAFSPGHSATLSVIQVRSEISQPSLYGLQFFST